MYSTQDFIDYTYRLHRLWKHIEEGGVMDILTMIQVKDTMRFYGYTPNYHEWWNPLVLFFVPSCHKLNPEIAKDFIKIKDFRDTKGIGEMHLPQYRMMAIYASKYRFANPMEFVLDPNSPKIWKVQQTNTEGDRK